MSIFAKQRTVVVGGLTLNVTIKNHKVIETDILGKKFTQKSDIPIKYSSEFIKFLENSKNEILNLDSPLSYARPENGNILRRQRLLLKSQFNKIGDMLVDKKDKKTISAILSSGLVSDKRVLDEAIKIINSPTGVRGVLYGVANAIVNFSPKDSVKALKGEQFDVNDFVADSSQIKDIPKEGDFPVIEAEQIEAPVLEKEMSQGDLQTKMMTEFFALMKEQLGQLNGAYEKLINVVDGLSAEKKEGSVTRREVKPVSIKKVVEESAPEKTKKETSSKLDIAGNSEIVKVITSLEQKYVSLHNINVNAAFADDRAAGRREVEQGEKQFNISIPPLKEKLISYVTCEADRTLLLRELASREKSLGSYDTYDEKNAHSKLYSDLSNDFKKLNLNQTQKTSQKKTHPIVQIYNSLKEEFKGIGVKLGDETFKMSKPEYDALYQRKQELFENKDLSLEDKIVELNGFGKGMLKQKESFFSQHQTLEHPNDTYPESDFDDLNSSAIGYEGVDAASQHIIDSAERHFNKDSSSTLNKDRKELNDAIVKEYKNKSSKTELK